MGSVFPLIADHALRAEDPDDYSECQVCGKKEVPVYVAAGNVIGDDGQADDDNEAYAACEACIQQGRIEHMGEYETDALLERFASKPNDAKAQLRATPRIPMMAQRDDWPVCCGELSEFVGSPESFEELIRVEKTARAWDQGPTDYKRNFDKTGPPESFHEVSLFLCGKCGTTSYVDQF